MMQLLSWLSFGLRAGKASRPNRSEVVEEHALTSHKWLPVISQGYCTGCARCMAACDHNCIEMVWEFATLQRPGDCGSEGNCMVACPEGVIRMDWVSTEGNPNVGRWRNTEVDREDAKTRRWT